MYNDKQLIILMAGKGTRLYPLTLTTPKCLLSLKQKPAIYNMIIPLINKGLRDITFVVNLENKSILETFMNNSFPNLNINFNYVIQEDFSGPGEALRLSRKYINKKVILLLGDPLVTYPSDYSKSFIAVQKVKNEDKNKYCIVESINNKITDLVNKPIELFAFPYGSYYACGLINKKFVLDTYKYGFCTVKSPITAPLVMPKYFLPRENVDTSFIDKTCKL